MKKIVFLMLAAGLMMMVGCKKTEEGEGPSGGNGTDTAAVVKHNVELVYGKNETTAWQNISLDTIRKYNNDKSVDTIFLVPEMVNQFSTYSTNQYKYIIPMLRERKNINPNKVWGKGELMLKAESVRDKPEIIAFFADTLKYNVTYNYQK